jgi:hypothetical protein
MDGRMIGRGAAAVFVGLIVFAGLLLVATGRLPQKPSCRKVIDVHEQYNDSTYGEHILWRCP